MQADTAVAAISSSKDAVRQAKALLDRIINKKKAVRYVFSNVTGQEWKRVEAFNLKRLSEVVDLLPINGTLGMVVDLNVPTLFTITIKKVILI